MDLDCYKQHSACTRQDSNCTRQDQTICIIGLGYVGEHLLSCFIKYNQYKIYGFDIDKNKLNMLQKKYLTVTDTTESLNQSRPERSCVTVPDTETLYGQKQEEKRCSTLFFTHDENDLKDVDLFCICVPTLLNKNKTGIDNTHILNVKNMLLRVAKEGSTIVIESSLFVGGTRQLFGCFLEKNINVGFSPQRVNPGSIDPPYDEIPKVISGLNMVSCDVINDYYSKIMKKVVPVSSCECAEMCKLYENCFRLINIAYVNEVSDLCSDYNINPYEMIEAASSKPFGFMPFTPGLGVGGHCIPVNPYYMGINGFDKLQCLHTSLKYLENRPKEKARMILNENKNMKNALVVGAAFKPGEKILTNSPSLALTNEFLRNNINVDIYDPLIQQTDNNCFSLFKPNYYINVLKNIYNYLFSKGDSDLFRGDNFDTGNIKWLDTNEFNFDNVINYDVIIVALKQHRIDWNILEQYESIGKKIYWLGAKPIQ